MEKDSEAIATLPRPVEAAHGVAVDTVVQGQETRLQVRQRVAQALARDEAQERRFLQVQGDGFVPHWRILAAAGLADAPILVDGFVQPLEDALTAKVRGLPGVLNALVEAADTLRHGCSVGSDFSRLRPAGAPVGGGPTRACGPVPLMRVFDRACDALATRPGAGPMQSALLRVDHPDIERFVDAGRTLSTFALCVGATDAFMQAVREDGKFRLVHPADPGFGATSVTAPDGVIRHVYRAVRARALWEHILRTAYDTGQPRIVYLDAVNRGNNLRSCETIEATTTGHQELAAYGGSPRGAQDLTRFVVEPFTARARFDHEAFARAVAAAVELLDRVLDVTAWPLPQHAAEGAAKRVVGVGFFGLAHAMAMLGQRHGSPAGASFAADAARTLRNAAYRASVQLAVAHGAFPLFDADALLAPGTFASTLPPDLQDLIRVHGIRNARLLSIAPMHTPSRTTGAEQVTLLAAMARCVDGSVGSTIDVPGLFPFEEFRDLYTQAWQEGLPGCAVRILRTAGEDSFRT